MLQAKKNTPATRVGAFAARISAIENVQCHQLVRVWACVARTATVAATVYQNGTKVVLEKSGNLISPVAAMTESAML